MQTVPIYDSMLLQSEVRRRLEHTRFTVRIDPKAQVPHFNGSEIVMSPPYPEQTVEAFKLQRGLAIHEIGHATEEGLEAMKLARRLQLDMKSPLGSMFNMTEDCRQEAITARKNKGDSKALSELCELICARQYTQIMREAPHLDEEGEKMLTALVTMLEAQASWNLGARSYPMLEKMLPQIAPLVAEVRKHGIAEQIDSAVTAQDAFDAAIAIHKILYPDQDPNDSMGKGKGEGEGEGSGKGKGKGKGEGEGEGDGDGDGKGEPSQEKQAANGTPQDCEPVKKQRKGLEWSDMVRSKHDTKSGHGMAIEFKDTDFQKGDGWTPYQLEDCKVYGGKELEDRAPHQHRRIEPDTDTSSARALCNRVRRLIQSTDRKRYKGAQDEGDIDSATIACLAQPGWTEQKRNVFATQVSKTAKNTAVTVLVDWSGSMSGHKSQTAANSAVRLASMFKSLGIPLEIIAFTTGSRPIYAIIKDFNENTVTGSSILARFRGIGSMGGNADGDALLYAHSRLRKRREKRHILLVLSDGSPTDCKSGGAHHGLNIAIKTIREIGRVELYGIGINDYSADRFYGKKYSRTITDITGLGDAVVEVLKEAIMK